MATDNPHDQATRQNGAVAWDQRGLAPAVVQHAQTGAPLMLAWMNAHALERTRTTGFAHFYSRSRQALWKKGETSGNTLRVREIRVDCDWDAILLIAEPAGPTCHTGATSCFFRVMGEPDRPDHTDDGPPGPPVGILQHLQEVLRTRRDQASAGKSYTKALLTGGFPKILSKIAEEHEELAEVLPAGDPDAVVHETADLLFHVMVGLVARDIPVEAVWSELARRFGTSGHAEKASRESRKP